MGADWPFTEENFTCTAEARNTTEVCETWTCYNGDCDLREHNGHPYGECLCDQGWQDGETTDFTYPRCDLCCSLPCVNGGECYYISTTKTRICNCLDTRYTGPYCEILKPTTTANMTIVTVLSEQSGLNTTSITVIAVVFGFLFLLLVATGVVLYISYKKRHKWALKFVQEIYYRFQKPEDDDPRKHDVFLSYRTSNDADRKFVVKTLLPGLEEMGFSTCIDHRDFIPGSFIAESIKVAVQFSRRSLLVLSPAYIDGEWPQYEVECAIIESLKKQHRIIPVIYKPIDGYKGKISPTLTQILESITYIEWPADAEGEGNNKKAVDDFWRRIKLSMPKKRDAMPQDDNDEGVKETKESRDIASSKSEALFMSNNSKKIGQGQNGDLGIHLERSPGGFLLNAV